eukprot:GILI01023460.1.p1 GENE.GILI01023460.1~~GILI01023460.1.p1  ORF type:complete len:441 (-),score=102.09 GILI01023460.1:45-1367(-)
MLRRSANQLAPKPKGGGGGGQNWAKQAAKMAEKYTKDFSNGAQGQQFYKKVAQTTAAVEAKAKVKLDHYWKAYHSFKQNINTGSSNKGQEGQNQNGASSSNSNSSAGEGNTTGDSRPFSQRISDFWNHNKQFIMSFLAANFMGVIFAIQFGSQIWSLLFGLWTVYWHNSDVKKKKIDAQEKKEVARRVAEEEREDALDDVYGGSAATTGELSFSSEPNAEAGKLTRAASAVNAAKDEELLQKRMARRDERRRRKEMEGSGLVMHDDSYSKREELRQGSNAGAGRGLERETQNAGPSGMDLLARQLIQREEDETIDQALSASVAAEAERRRLHQQLFFQERKVAKKELSKKEKRKMRRAKREAELQKFFAAREAAARLQSSHHEERAHMPEKPTQSRPGMFGRAVSDASELVYDFTQHGLQQQDSTVGKQQIHDFTSPSYT